MGSKDKINPPGPGGGELDQGQVQELEVSGKAPDQASHKINHLQPQHQMSVVSKIDHHMIYLSKIRQAYMICLLFKLSESTQVG